ncbi:MAG: hypothetical protein AAGF06_00185 [Pseudomonadota bacterium]
MTFTRNTLQCLQAILFGAVGALMLSTQAVAGHQGKGMPVSDSSTVTSTLELTSTVATSIPEYTSTVAVLETESNPFTSSLDKRHKMASTGWLSLVNELDRTLSGDVYKEYDLAENDSYLKITLSGTLDKEEFLTPDVRVRARVDLPNTARRWQLYFDSEDNRDVSLEDRVLEKDLQQSGLRQAAVQWMVRQSDNWKDSFRVGVRDIPINPFVRYKHTYTQPLSEDKKAVLNNAVYYSREDKLYVDSSFKLIKPLSAERYLSNETKVTWKEEDDSFESANVTVYSKPVTSSSEVRYSGGLLAMNKPSVRLNSVFLRTAYSQKLYKDWLYLDVSPLLEFSRDNDFDPTPSVTMKVHMYLK